MGAFTYDYISGQFESSIIKWDGAIFTNYTLCGPGDWLVDLWPVTDDGPIIGVGGEGTVYILD